MGKKNGAETPSVDDLLDGAESSATAATSATTKKAKAKKAAPAAAAKKAKPKPAAGGSKKAPATPAKKAPGKAGKKAKADAAPAAALDSPIRKALLKVRKSTSYADFSDANGFNIRTVRRMARQLRDAGEIGLSRDGQTVYIEAAV
jgi:pyruvate/2-oxoglutarate dehydrogenase complex dihydrolipoamide acyltransferase (E2) component